MIREGKNPTTIKDELASYLPLHNRERHCSRRRLTSGYPEQVR